MSRIVCTSTLKFYFSFIYFFVDPNEFHLLPWFKKHDNLIPEADFYCLQDLKDLLKMEVKKNAMTITFCTQHTPSSKVLCLSQDTLGFYELYMNTEEKEAFMSNTLNMRQIIRMKMQLQKGGFSCLSSDTKFNENGFDMEVILTETFKRKWNVKCVEVINDIRRNWCNSITTRVCAIAKDFLLLLIKCFMEAC